MSSSDTRQSYLRVRKSLFHTISKFFNVFNTGTVFVRRLYVPAFIMMCDGGEPVGIYLISDLISSVFFPGKVWLTA